MMNKYQINQLIAARAAEADQELLPFLQEPGETRYTAIREMWSNPDFSLSERVRAVIAGNYPHGVMSKTEIWNYQKFWDTVDNYHPRTATLEIRKRVWFIDNFFALYFLEFPFKTSAPPTFTCASIEDFLEAVDSLHKW